MAFISKDDLTSLMYEEDMDAITEGKDEEITGDTGAIAIGITEAKGYLNRFDTAVLFAREENERDPLLVETCKSLALYYLTKKCAPNQNVKDIRAAANDARIWLAKVQSGKLTPIGWPLKAAPEANTFFHVSSYPKRKNNI
ncbi:phage protein Gp36 family protein [Mucilaginibacter rubeus]|uniref:DUF1320 domain-containing protein n=1 Tax=Mucilaginibacter rubeus TaxID=2027860 RepID=A0A5C1I7W6_9SPHI|nr:phage protein Gp36 family protein [Mucilaginibacter rubeus]QEM13470.1 DUF1320 domain-containing protein [Mucilaginibacter rubeus]